MALGQIDIEQVADLQTELTGLQTEIDNHEALTNNPHGVTAAQVGAYSTATADSTFATIANLTSHTGNTSNPHSVTAAQVGAIPTTQKGAASGVAELDSNGKVPTAQLPALALERLVVVANQAARYALTTASVQNGDVVKQTDTLAVYVVSDDTQLNGSGGYTLIATASAAPVDSVFGRVGAVVALAGDYTTDQVNNASTVDGGTGTLSDVLEGLAADIAAAVPTYNYMHGTPSGSVNGSNTDFTPRNAANSANVTAIPAETEVYLNNLWQEPGVNYTWESSNTIIRFATAPQNGWRVRVRGKHT